MLGYFLTDGEFDNMTTGILEKAIKKAGLVPVIRMVTRGNSTFAQTVYVRPGEEQKGDMTPKEYEAKKKLDKAPKQPEPEPAEKPNTENGSKEEKEPKKVEAEQPKTEQPKQEEKKDPPKPKTDKDLSATDANDWIPPMTYKNTKDHWDGVPDENGGWRVHPHKAEFPGKTMNEYRAMAIKLAHMPVGGNVLGHEAVTKRGEKFIVRYDKANNLWVKAFYNGPATFYKPAKGEAYYHANKKLEGGKP